MAAKQTLLGRDRREKTGRGKVARYISCGPEWDVWKKDGEKPLGKLISRPVALATGFDKRFCMLAHDVVDAVKRALSTHCSLNTFTRVAVECSEDVGRALVEE